jgi:hypothetical protein
MTIDASGQEELREEIWVIHHEALFRVELTRDTPMGKL